MASKVTLVKGEQSVTSDRPTTITQLKSQGFTVREDKPAPKPGPVSKPERGDADK